MNKNASFHGLLGEFIPLLVSAERRALGEGAWYTVGAEDDWVPLGLCVLAVRGGAFHLGGTWAVTCCVEAGTCSNPVCLKHLVSGLGKANRGHSGARLPGDPSFRFLLGLEGGLAWPSPQSLFTLSCSQARDDDSGNNGAILFSIFQVDFIAKDGAVIPFQGFFRISTSSEASVFTGNIE